MKHYIKYLSTRRVIFLILSLLIIIFIYFNSLQVGHISQNMSDGVIESLNNLKIFDSKIYGFIQNIFIKLYPNIIDIKNLFIRKMAHILEFSALSFCVLQLFALNLVKLNLKEILISVNISFLIAFIDEVIQLFVPNRAGQLQDVLIDFLGIIIGVILFIVICLIARLFYRRNNNEQ